MLTIPGITYTPPYSDCHSFPQIREYLLQPKYLNGDKTGQRIPVVYALYNPESGHMVDHSNDITSSMFKRNNVYITANTNLMLAVIDRSELPNPNNIDAPENAVQIKPVYSIPANIACFIVDIFRK